MTMLDKLRGKTVSQESYNQTYPRYWEELESFAGVDIEYTDGKVMGGEFGHGNGGFGSLGVGWLGKEVKIKLEYEEGGLRQGVLVDLTPDQAREVAEELEYLADYIESNQE